MSGLEEITMKRYYASSAVDNRTIQIIALLLLPAGVVTLFSATMEGCALILIAASVGLLGSVRRN